MPPELLNWLQRSLRRWKRETFSDILRKYLLLPKMLTHICSNCVHTMDTLHLYIYYRSYKATLLGLHVTNIWAGLFFIRKNIFCAPSLIKHLCIYGIFMFSPIGVNTNLQYFTFSPFIFFRLNFRVFFLKKALTNQLKKTSATSNRFYIGNVRQAGLELHI